MDPHAITSMFIGTIHFVVTRWIMTNFSLVLIDEAEGSGKTMRKP